MSKAAVTAASSTTPAATAAAAAASSAAVGAGALQTASQQSVIAVLPGGRKLTQAIISQGKKILGFELPTGGELHEEYDVITDELLMRKFRPRLPTGSAGSWTVEVGTERGGAFVPDRDLLKESSAMPIMTRKDDASTIRYRIRNLDYPADVFAVTVDGADPHSIVVRTSNKKFYKKLQIPELVRAGMPLDGAALSHEHERGTLIISYKKPMFLLSVEHQDKLMRSGLKFRRVDDPSAAADGPGCAQQ
jgi:hypothetical protein